MLRLMVVLFVLISSGCTATKQAATRTVDAVVDCTTGSAPALIEQFGPLAVEVIRAATKPDGTVDLKPFEATAEGALWDVAGCVWAHAFHQVAQGAGAAGFAPMPTTPLQATWERIRHESLGGRRFRLADGTEI